MTNRFFLYFLGAFFALAGACSANAAKCLNNWKWKDCDTVFGDTKHWYCVVDSYSNGWIECSNCSSGVPGEAGHIHCGGWTAGWDYSQEGPTGSGGPEGDRVGRDVVYGKCEEQRNLARCRYSEDP